MTYLRSTNQRKNFRNKFLAYSAPGNIPYVVSKFQVNPFCGLGGVNTRTDRQTDRRTQDFYIIGYILLIIEALKRVCIQNKPKIHALNVKKVMLKNHL